VARLTGGEPPSPVENDEATIGDLKARIAETIETLGSAEAADFEGCEDRVCSVAIPGGGGVIAMNGFQYLRSWALPHFYFHVVTAYDILRHHGVELGKRDYMSHVGVFIRRGERADRASKGHRQPEAAIFSRAALARKPDRVKPVRRAAASIASSNPRSKEMFAFTGRPASITSGTDRKTAPSAIACSTAGSRRNAAIVRGGGAAPAMRASCIHSPNASTAFA
jgi:hypothetical protein